MNYLILSKTQQLNRCYDILYNIMERKSQMINYVPQKFSNFEKGLDLQREIYKQANLNNDFEVMMKVLENIKSETKAKIIASGGKEKIVRVESIIMWYKTLPMRYLKRTPNGTMVKYPANINIRISKHLNGAYEILVEQLVKLKLI